jgi:hypothetical protein
MKLKEFEHLYTNLTNEKFLKNEALGGEVPFYIFPYKIEEQNKVYENIEILKKRLQRKGISVYEINLFDLSIEMLKKRNAFKRLIENESKLTKKRLLDMLKMILDPENKMTKKIEEKVLQNYSNIVFLTGIGEVYPFIRSHIILNNLQNKVKDRPLVMFYPGVYTKELSLFGRMKEENYYRAFNLNKLYL